MLLVALVPRSAAILVNPASALIQRSKFPANQTSNVEKVYD